MLWINNYDALLDMLIRGISFELNLPFRKVYVNYHSLSYLLKEIGGIERIWSEMNLTWNRIMNAIKMKCNVI